MRGGSQGPNYAESFVSTASEQLKSAGLNPAVMVDCSHGNSNKDYTRQPEVLSDVLDQVTSGTSSIIGAMLESNLSCGNQKFPQPLDALKYGVSITDECIDFETTESVIKEAYSRLG